MSQKRAIAGSESADLTILQARALVEIAAKKSYEATAQTLSLSPSAVRHRLNRMAYAINSPAPLVTGAVRGRVELTSAGEQALPLATQIVVAHDALTGNRPGEIRFACYPALAAQLAAPIARFEDSLRQLRVSFYEISDQTRRDRGERLIRGVSSGEIDVVVAPAGRGRGGLAEEYAYSWMLRVVLPDDDHPDFASQDDGVIRLDDLKSRVFLVSPRGHNSRRLFEAAAAACTYEPQVGMELVDQVVLKRIAKEGRGYAAIIPEDAYGARDPSLGPVLLGADGRPLGGSYAIYYLKSHHDPKPGHAAQERSKAIVGLVELLKDTIGDGSATPATAMFEALKRPGDSSDI